MSLRHVVTIYAQGGAAPSTMRRALEAAGFVQTDQEGVAIMFADPPDWPLTLTAQVIADDPDAALASILRELRNLGVEVADASIKTTLVEE